MLEELDDVGADDLVLVIDAEVVGDAAGPAQLVVAGVLEAE